MPPGPGKRPGFYAAVPPGPAAQPDPAGPLVLGIAAGRPSAEEIAAVVLAVLATRAASASEAGVAGRLRNKWSSRSLLVREPLRRGPGGWRASTLPR